MSYLPSLYQVYSFTLTQGGGTTAPTVTQYENTITGGTPTWSYSATGQYNVTIAGGFPITALSPQHQTGGIDKNTDSAYYIYAERISNDVFKITTRDELFAPANGLLQDKFFEIRVY